MASVDAPEKNADFARQHGEGVVILSDPEKTAARAYGVLAEAGYAKRQTFYIDPDGVIRHVDRNVSAAGHGAEIAQQLGALGFPRRSKQ